MDVQISDCCGAAVKSSCGVYICRECLEPCDLAMDEEDVDIRGVF